MQLCLLPFSRNAEGRKEMWKVRQPDLGELRKTERDDVGYQWGILSMPRKAP